MSNGDEAPTTVARGLANSWRGLHWALVHEWSFRRQILGSLALMGVMALVRPELVWWILAALVSLYVLSLELINTAIEVFLDHFHPERNGFVGLVKDLASAAVVLGNAGQAVVGITVLVLGWRSFG